MSDVKRQHGQEAEAVSPAKPLRRSAWRIAGKVTVWVVAGGCTLVLVDAMMNPLSGALRSTQLKWEERRKEADAAVAESDAAEARSVTEDREGK